MSVSRTAAIAVTVIALILGLVPRAQAWEYDPYRSKEASWDYARDGVRERYEWGGAKFRNNDNWDNDEGADCSGYAAKVWAVDHYSYPMTYYHPYSTFDFYYGFPYAFFKDRTRASLLTAWTYRDSEGGPSDHMGLFRTQTSDGSWTTYEARGSSYGIVVHTRWLSTLINWNYRRSDRKSWGA
jgi:hypothetical protein